MRKNHSHLRYSDQVVEYRLVAGLLWGCWLNLDQPGLVADSHSGDYEPRWWRWHCGWGPPWGFLVDRQLYGWSTPERAPDTQSDDIWSLNKDIKRPHGVVCLFLPVKTPSHGLAKKRSSRMPALPPSYAWLVHRRLGFVTILRVPCRECALARQG